MEVNKIRGVLLVFALSIISILSFKSVERVPDNEASVYQSQGLYVFIQAKPLHEYEVLGTVKKTGFTWSGKPSETYNIILKRARQDYPNCEGVIFDDVSMEHAVCIKFK